MNCVVTLVLPLLLVSTAPAASADTLEFRNGLWFDGQGFTRTTAYAVDGVLTFKPPARVNRMVDLEGRYIIPPHAETQTHSLSRPDTLDRHSLEYAKNGIFYVMVQDAATELGPQILNRVNRPDSVDVSYTQRVVTPSWSMIAEFYEQMGEEGRFGGKQQSLKELDQRVLFLVDSREDLERKFDKLASLNCCDFIKVILGFSEELEKRPPPENLWVAFTLATPVDASQKPEPLTLRDLINLEAVRAAGNLEKPAISRKSQPSAPRATWVQRHPVLTGTLIGAGLGAASSSIRWTELYCANGGDEDCFFHGSSGVFFGGAAGAGVGALIGWLCDR